MKRTIPTIILMFIAIGTAVAQTEPQAPCPPNGITTDPVNPVNPLHNEDTPDPVSGQEGNYDFRNWFDWTQSDWPAYFDLGQTSTLRSPFFLNEGAISHFYTNKDFQPEDGWELVSFHLGLDKDDNPDPENIGMPT